VDERAITFGASTCVRLKSLDDVFIATPVRVRDPGSVLRLLTRIAKALPAAPNETETQRT
jgi:hypothetical protein